MELKFKAQRNHNSEKVYFDLKYFLENDEAIMPNAFQYVLKNIRQFTGLNDKNGVEIYDGDIVKDDELGIGTVVFQSGCFFIMYDADTNMEFLGLKTDKFGRLQEKRIVEIIGNIIDNPEILQ